MAVKALAAAPAATEATAELRSRMKRRPRWTDYMSSVVAGEISTLTRYYDRVIQWLPRENDNGAVMHYVDAPEKAVIEEGEPFPDLRDESDRRTAVLLNGTLNHHHDIQGLLSHLKTRLSATSRVVVVLYNPYLRVLYTSGNRLGLRRGELPSTFITRLDLRNLAELAGFSVVRQRTSGYFPWRWLGLGGIVNRCARVFPALRWLSLAYVVTLRPRVPRPRPGLTCVIPARNERGNIEGALQRFPALGCPIEIIFVEGGSTDGTWEEIQRVAQRYRGLFQIQVLKQTGKGKADAVRLGFAHATQPLLTILDADLTMPPEMLRRFYDAYCEGHADFINGSRLIYPMEGEAMRFLNRLGNVFFAKALSWVLDNLLSDSLCGTKLMLRSDYERMRAWRREFGDFDPFGDFELLFPAAVLALGTVDIPVRYLERRYGSTNINRFRNGIQLLRMTWIGLIRIKLGANRRVPFGK